ncbi:MAG: Flp pilus assembly complex ATPase component TadA [Deltaproteobacteria bacterium]|nr:Flp pilus assembly complex ATPase component TadA [Deltaproteobacteria bacterium]
MSLERWVSAARDAGASDLHLEPGMPLALRVRGELKMVGEPLANGLLLEAARELVGVEGWAKFYEQRSADLARTVAGVRCRINILQTLRGVGLVVRLLSPFQATLKKLNLHPSLRKLVEARHGLVIVSGPTGSGKSTTLAALIQELNLAEARHIVTIESPTEYVLAPRQSLIRQREVGRHTPSVAQALLDALREDPDVLMVGEMREPETMRLTLNAAETGHLVLTTMHSSSCAEALQRLVGAFPAEVQAGVSAHLADCLVGVVCQRLRFRPEQKLLVPECEILIGTTATRAVIRQGQFFKLATAMEGGGQDGNWSFARYREWLDAKADWSTPLERAEVFDAPVESAAPLPPIRANPVATRKPKSEPKPEPVTREDGVVVIDDAEDPEDVLAELDRRRH